MHTCSWCGTHYVGWQNQCDKCGGPMPPLPGMELGSPPPPKPRQVSKKYAFRVRWSHNMGVLIGGCFTAVGALFMLPMIVNRLFWPSLFPLLFLVGGLSMFRYGWRSASSTLRAFRHGEAVKGKIASLSKDTSQSINGRHPWRLVYHFPVGNQMQEGVVTSFDSTVGERRIGQPLWVLYLEDDPAQNAVYPPLV